MKIGVDRIVLVVNGSPEPVCKQIESIVSAYAPFIILEKFAVNEGSAKGFKRGLEIAAETDCEFIWVLDDDNLPDDNALAALRDFWEKGVTSDGNRSIIALASLRKDRIVFTKALDERDPNALLWPANSYYGFHFKEMMLKVKERTMPAQVKSEERDWQPMKIDVTCYGGFFFPKWILNTIGFPDERLVLYVDDLVFTQAISHLLGEIWLIPQSIVHDVDASFYIKEKKGLLYHSTLDGRNDAQVYYLVRNTIYYMSAYLVTNRWAYYLNKLLFLAFISFAGIARGKFKRLFLIYAALKQGENGRLGKSDRYTL
jgi:GT2 family glycosyltransferase